jgi:hypothetical protein
MLLKRNQLNAQGPDTSLEPKVMLTATAGNLKAVGKFTGSGTAKSTFFNYSGFVPAKASEFKHTVKADLKAPAKGKFYEGWIVNGNSVISTGKLNLNKKGKWVAKFSGQKNLLNHTVVVVTEETSANGLDGIPETHVLEGNLRRVHEKVIEPPNRRMPSPLASVRS